MIRTVTIAALVAGIPAVSLTGCSSTRIALNEQLGYTKREQLVDRVKEARDEQVEAKQQFASALDEFKAMTGASGGELEKQYEKINKSYDKSKSQADDVTSRIASVERVAGLLFAEWKEEINQISSADAKRASEAQREKTMEQYDKLLGAMKTAESKMKPVLTALNDRRLLLKHSLNAAAIASLQGNLAQLETDVDSLIREMQAAIDEANMFIEQAGR